MAAVTSVEKQYAPTTGASGTSSAAMQSLRDIAQNPQSFHQVQSLKQSIDEPSYRDDTLPEQRAEQYVETIKQAANNPNRPQQVDPSSISKTYGARKPIKTAGTAAQVSGTAAQAAGKTARVTGKTVSKGGDAAIRAGGALSSTVVGAVAGVPLMVAGGAAKVGGEATAAAGRAVDSAGKSTRRAGTRAKRATTANFTSPLERRAYRIGHKVGSTKTQATVSIRGFAQKFSLRFATHISIMSTPWHLINHGLYLGLSGLIISVDSKGVVGVTKEAAGEAIKGEFKQAVATILGANIPIEVALLFWFISGAVGWLILFSIAGAFTLGGSTVKVRPLNTLSKQMAFVGGLIFYFIPIAGLFPWAVLYCAVLWFHPD